MKRTTTTKGGYLVSFVPAWEPVRDATRLTVRKIYRKKSTAESARRKLKRRGDKAIRIRKL